MWEGRTTAGSTVVVGTHGVQIPPLPSRDGCASSKFSSSLAANGAESPAVAGDMVRGDQRSPWGHALCEAKGSSWLQAGLGG